MKCIKLNKKTMLFTCYALFALIANGEVICSQAQSVYDGGDDDKDPWKDKNKIPHHPLSITNQSSIIIVANATSEEDITAKVIDEHGFVVLSEIIPAEETSYFTIYVGDLLSGTYQLVLNIDGDDFLSWPFEIIN